MIQLVPSPVASAFSEFIERIEESAIICSPYITKEPVEILASALERKAIQRSINLQIITNVSPLNVAQGSTDAHSLARLQERVPNTKIVYLPRVHAKVYVNDAKVALISSANFTQGGSYANLEYGVCTDDAVLVKQVVADLVAYAKLGSEVTASDLFTLAEKAAEFRRYLHEAQQQVRKNLRDLTKAERATEDELIEIRVRDRSVNSIFCDTVLFLLQKASMRTEELHKHVSEIHSDLCDESVDRVIAGQHFGKLWKHQVRIAQATLKRRGKIRNDPATGYWSAVPHTAPL